MNKVRYITVDAEYAGQRIDNFLSNQLKGVPKSHIYRIIRSGEVRINQKRAKPTSRLAAGDKLRIPPVSVATPVLSIAKTQDFSWFAQHILFENEQFMVINKPAGLAVHGGSGVSLGVIELLRYLHPHCQHLELVHRLDKETSGCLIVAKKRSVLKELHQQLRDKDVEKVYVALLRGVWQGKAMQKVDVSLLKYCNRDQQRFVKVDAAGKSSQTQFTLIRNGTQCCWVEARPKTGRTHQIRVHAAFLKHPIVGDSKYGDAEFNKHMAQQGYKRLMLHAQSIKFTLDGKPYFFTVPLDFDVDKVI